MLIYELLQVLDNVKLYKYYPEGDMTAEGVVSVNENGVGEIIKLSVADKHKNYAFKAMYSNKPNELSGTIAWY